ncbi:CMRF35-like molecule 5 isoform X3 [Siphateles boraxobius]|uniref:CMRF35-like molecule 5 isoform X3 n=1 Tax=Siphateles boraxobius TaxID=180520 RepID=UPI0040641A21
MKFPLIVCVFLLTVSSSLSVNVTVNGTEGRHVSITCPFPEGFLHAYSYKYFYRGHYRDRVIILQSDGMETFVSSGRFSLQDNHQTRSFTVTISILKMEDAGPYGCKAGHGYENYQQVELIVIRAPETTTRVQISTSSVSPYTNRNTEHTSTVLRSDLASVAGGLGSVLLVLTLCCGTFIILKKRKRKSGTDNPETDCMAEEIQNTDFNVVTSSSNQTPAFSSNQTPAFSSNQTPAFSSNQTPAFSSNQTPASHLNNCTYESTVYATVTNQQPDSNSSHTHSTNQVTDTVGDYNYLTATHPLNITTDEDPLKAPRFWIN